MYRLFLIFVAVIFFTLGLRHANADDSVWIYLYAHEADQPRRILEVVGDTDKFELCEFYRDMLDRAMEDHPTAFHTCVVPSDLANGVAL